MSRAIRSSSSSRRFSSAWVNRSAMLPVIALNDSASSPSWSSVSTRMRRVRSPRRTRSVPANSSCTAPVIDLARAKPITRATASMVRNITPIAISPSRKTLARLTSPPSAS